MELLSWGEFHQPLFRGSQLKFIAMNRAPAQSGILELFQAKDTHPLWWRVRHFGRQSSLSQNEEPLENALKPAKRVASRHDTPPSPPFWLRRRDRSPEPDTETAPKRSGVELARGWIAGPEGGLQGEAGLLRLPGAREARGPQEAGGQGRSVGGFWVFGFGWAWRGDWADDRFFGCFSLWNIKGSQPQKGSKVLSGPCILLRNQKTHSLLDGRRAAFPVHFLSVAFA